MNIKEAKEEIVHTVRAYTAKDDFGNYEMCIRDSSMCLYLPELLSVSAL